jgi:hypothetical protein
MGLCGSKCCGAITKEDIREIVEIDKLSFSCQIKYIDEKVSQIAINVFKDSYEKQVNIGHVTLNCELRLTSNTIPFKYRLVSKYIERVLTIKATWIQGPRFTLARLLNCFQF